MLLEVVQSRPNLVFVPAIVRRTLPRILSRIDAMHAFAVTIKVIGRAEALARSAAVWFRTHPYLVVSKHVFSISAIVSICTRQMGGWSTHL